MSNGNRKRMLFGGLILFACLFVSALELFLFFQGVGFLGGLLAGDDLETLAIEAVAEAAGPGATDIELLQRQEAGAGQTLHGLLLTYRQNQAAFLTLVVMREAEDGHEVVETLAGPASQGGDLDAQVRFVPHRLDTEVAVFGPLPDPVTDRVVVAWPIGYELEATLDEGTYFLFRSWSPVDGSPVPASVTAYNADGLVISRVSLADSGAPGPEP